MMTYGKIFFLVLALLVLCGGCGLTEGVIQKEPKSFILFSGNTQNAIVYIDDLAPINLNQDLIVTGDDGVGNPTRTRSNKNVHYAIATGKHKIVVKKAGEELVNRDVLLGNGITKEIQIP